METKSALCLLLLLNQLLLAPTDADKELSTIQTYSSPSQDQHSSPTSTVNPTYITSDQNSTDSTISLRGNCLIDTEMGLIAVCSAGGLIICLLVAIIVLANQIFLLKRRICVPRSSRSNLDLVSSAGYWDTNQEETGGVVGLCNASIILEELKEDSQLEEERLAKMQEAMVEAGGPCEEETKAKVFNPEEKIHLIQRSTSRDSCSELPRDIEDMPLVV